MAINRRSFILGLINSAMSQLPGGREKRWAVLNEFYIAGYQYHKGPRIESHIKKGQSLGLVREPKNRYDKKAVKIMLPRFGKIGYVPRVSNSTISYMMDNKVKLKGIIAKFKPKCEPWWRVKIKVIADVQAMADSGISEREVLRSI